VTAVIRETNWFTDTFALIKGKITDNATNYGNQTHWIMGSFPEKLVDKKDAYPFLIIMPPDVSYNPLTLGGIKRGPARITFEIYSTKVEDTDKIASDVVNIMEAQEDNFHISGIATMRMTGSSYTYYPRDSFRVHNKTINYEFDFGWY